MEKCVQNKRIESDMQCMRTSLRLYTDTSQVRFVYSLSAFLKRNSVYKNRVSSNIQTKICTNHNHTFPADKRSVRIFTTRTRGMEKCVQNKRIESEMQSMRASLRLYTDTSQVRFVYSLSAFLKRNSVYKNRVSSNIQAKNLHRSQSYFPCR